MKNFYRSGGAGGRDKRGGDRRGGGGRFGDRDGGRAKMYEATCSDCGRDCEVPFRPTSGKPVFCDRCFKKDSGNSFSRSDDRRSDRRDFGNDRQTEMFEAVCAECGDDCEVPFRPSGSKPVYCSNCFGKGGEGASSKGKKYDAPARSTDEKFLNEVGKLHIKLDTILRRLDHLNSNQLWSENMAGEIEVPVVQSKKKKKKTEAPSMDMAADQEIEVEVVQAEKKPSKKKAATKKTTVKKAVTQKKAPATKKAKK